MTAAYPNETIETEVRGLGYALVAGVDEAGRGPLAGPVVAAAVIAGPDGFPEGVNDSKRLSKLWRRKLQTEIAKTCGVGVGIATAEEIDAMNVLRAAHLAMERALADLSPMADFALIDGNLVPRDLALPARAVVKGDALSLSIAAASIIAKCSRDAIMEDLAQQFPGYGWERNAAYPTPEHLKAIRDIGVTPHHRRSFKPVHNILCREKS